MKSKTLFINTVIVGLIIITSSCNNQQIKESDNPKKQTVSDTLGHGYNELANTDNRQTFTISDYNTDNLEIKNIDRPVSSKIKTKLDTNLLFNIWTSDPNGPHADFILSIKGFYVVDYDGNGNMPYELNGNNLKIYYNDFIQDGKIIAIDKDTLKIKWQDFDDVNYYVRWPQFSE